MASVKTVLPEFASEDERIAGGFARDAEDFAPYYHNYSHTDDHHPVPSDFTVSDDPDVLQGERRRQFELLAYTTIGVAAVGTALFTACLLGGMYCAARWFWTSMTCRRQRRDSR